MEQLEDKERLKNTSSKQIRIFSLETLKALLQLIHSSGIKLRNTSAWNAFGSAHAYLEPANISDKMIIMRLCPSGHGYSDLHSLRCDMQLI